MIYEYSLIYLRPKPDGRVTQSSAKYQGKLGIK